MLLKLKIYAAVTRRRQVYAHGYQNVGRMKQRVQHSHLKPDHCMAFPGWLFMTWPHFVFLHRTNGLKSPSFAHEKNVSFQNLLIAWKIARQV